MTKPAAAMHENVLESSSSECSAFSLCTTQVRYLPSSSRGSQVLRQVLHRPLDTTASSSTAGSNVLVVSSYDAVTGELVMRAKQRCAFTRSTVKVSLGLADSRRV